MQSVSALNTLNLHQSGMELCLDKKNIGCSPCYDHIASYSHKVAICFADNGLRLALGAGPNRVISAASYLSYGVNQPVSIPVTVGFFAMVDSFLSSVRHVARMALVYENYKFLKKIEEKLLNGSYKNDETRKLIKEKIKRLYLETARLTALFIGSLMQLGSDIMRFLAMFITAVTPVTLILLANIVGLVMLPVTLLGSVYDGIKSFLNFKYFKNFLDTLRKSGDKEQEGMASIKELVIKCVKEGRNKNLFSFAGNGVLSVGSFVGLFFLIAGLAGLSFTPVLPAVIGCVITLTGAALLIGYSVRKMIVSYRNRVSAKECLEVIKCLEVMDSGEDNSLLNNFKNKYNIKTDEEALAVAVDKLCGLYQEYTLEEIANRIRKDCLNNGWQDSEAYALLKEITENKMDEFSVICQDNVKSWDEAANQLYIDIKTLHENEKITEQQLEQFEQEWKAGPFSNMGGFLSNWGKSKESWEDALNKMKQISGLTCPEYARVLQDFEQNTTESINTFTLFFKAYIFKSLCARLQTNFQFNDNFSGATASTHGNLNMI